MRSLGWALLWYVWCPYKRQKLHVKPETQVEFYVSTEEKIDMVQLQAKEYQGLTAITKS